MPTGTVKWFNAEKGFGFILQNSGGPDLFVHHTGITGPGYRQLHEGQKVTFDVIQSHKGPEAENVTPE
ncbi:MULTISPECIES: cold-shock protein [unclassified Streptomyces]|uniref:Cold-shock protein n=1 Tax=Streptomyces sp. NBC_00180 TaxID=2903632 RepID=A0AAU1I9P3_9ACTN|nr:cold-shock protein [Streptomyces sp. NBC_01017]WSV34937.1 cold-shock protein [Streptomyces sp. NBC_01017]